MASAATGAGREEGGSFHYHLHRTSQRERWGLSLLIDASPNQPAFLCVHGVEGDGLVARRNAVFAQLAQKYPAGRDRQLREGDRLVRVNGQTDVQDMRTQFVEARDLHLAVFRSQVGALPQDPPEPVRPLPVLPAGPRLDSVSTSVGSTAPAMPEEGSIELEYDQDWSLRGSSLQHPAASGRSDAAGSPVAAAAAPQLAPRSAGAGGLFVATMPYEPAELEPTRGYLALKAGDRVQVQSGTQQLGAAGSAFPEYVFGHKELEAPLEGENERGWIPVQRLAPVPSTSSHTAAAAASAPACGRGPEGAWDQGGSVEAQTLQQRLRDGGLLIATASYNPHVVERNGGYLALKQGDLVELDPDTRALGDEANAFDEYVYGGLAGEAYGLDAKGWLPVMVLGLPPRQDISTTS